MAVIHGTNIEVNKVPSLDLRFSDRKSLVDTIDSGSANAAYAGTLQTLDTAISGLPNTATQLSLGNSGQPGNLSRGHISRLTYYPERLPDTTLQRLTR